MCKAHDLHATLPPTTEGHVAFTRNLEATLDEIQPNGAKTLLVPFRLSPHVPADDAWCPLMAYSEERLRAIAARRKLSLAPFPASAISPENWGDHCHLNAAGAREKATHIAAAVKRLFP